MTDRGQFMRRLAPAFSVVVAIVAAWILIKAWPNWQANRLADSWREELETADDDRVPVLINQLADLGDTGLEQLVAALSSPRKSVRQQAAVALGRFVDHWEICDASARSAAAGRLSSLLAEHVETFPPDARENAASLIQQMLVWPTDDAFVDRGELVAACETVLLATDDIGIEPSGHIAVARREVRTSSTNTDRDMAAIVELPGGGLSVDPSQPPPLPKVNEPPAAAPPRDPREPGLLLDGDESGLPPAPLPIFDPAVDPIRRTSSHGDDKNSNQPANYPRALEGASAERNPSAADNSGGRRDVSESRAAEGPTSTRETSLIRLLDSQEAIAGEAEAQLRDLGYSDRELAIARQAGSRDRADRLQLVESLPKLSGVRPRLWLEMLLDDEDAAIRGAAIAQLATSGDAGTVEALSRRFRFDPDAGIRQQVERLRKASNR
jgi:hypothetical protein